METGTSSPSATAINLTASAAAHVTSLLTQQPENQGKFLRLYVEAGGCSGMQYGMVFDDRRDGDVLSECQGVQVLVDPFSSNYLGGCVLDYVDSLNGSGFKISNPNAQQTCGCGKSFEA